MIIIAYMYNSHHSLEAMVHVHVHICLVCYETYCSFVHTCYKHYQISVRNAIYLHLHVHTYTCAHVHVHACTTIYVHLYLYTYMYMYYLCLFSCDSTCMLCLLCT